MHYLIDLDNTLLNTFFRTSDGKMHFYWATNLQSDLGINPETLNLLFTIEFMQILQTDLDIAPFVTRYLKKISSSVSSSEFINYWLTHNSDLNTSVWNWIKKTKNQNIYFHITSDQPHIRMKFLWNKFKEWQDVFDMIFTSANFNSIYKDDKKFFELVLEQLHEYPDNVCLIDDNITNITVAKKLGIRTILFKSIDDLNLYG